MGFLTLLFAGGACFGLVSYHCACHLCCMTDNVYSYAVVSLAAYSCVKSSQVCGIVYSGLSFDIGKVTNQ